MESSSLILPTLFFLTVWLLILSAVFYWLVRHYQRLISNSKGENLKQILDKIFREIELDTREIKGLTKRVSDLEDESFGYIQKVGLVRFNPFDESGGNQSFSLALLDKNESGVVITGLHGRGSTRLYTKRLTKGESRHELSKEEKVAIKEANKK